MFFISVHVEACRRTILPNTILTQLHKKADGQQQLLYQREGLFSNQ